MNKEQWMSIVRTILNVIGAYLVGKNLFGNTIDPVLWQGIAGAVLSLAMTVWGFMDATTSLEGFQSGLMNIVKFVGGVLIAGGKLTLESLETWSGILVVIIPMIYRFLSRKKTAMLATGDIKLDTLKGYNDQV